MEGQESTKKKARKKGTIAAGSAAASVALIAVAPLPLGLIAAGISGWAAWDWFRYRARNGLRF